MRSRDEIESTLGPPIAELTLEALLDIRQCIIAGNSLLDEIRVLLQQPPRPTPLPIPTYTLGEIECVRRGNPIMAIKLVRERLGLSLKEAKDMVDNMRAVLRIGSET